MTDSALFTLGGRECPVCGRALRAPLDLRDFRLAGCSACGCYASDAFVRNATTSFEPNNYFDNAQADRGRWDDLFQRLAREKRQVRSLLDVGCGTGAFLHYAQHELALDRAAGIELDPGRADQARELNPSATIHGTDAVTALSNLPGGEDFDLITLLDVLEHVPAPGALLSALARRVSESGCILIQTIHERSLLPGIGRATYRLTGGVLRAVARRTHEPHHLVFFSRAGLDHLAAKAGLRVLHCWFDRLEYARIDGNRVVARLSSLAMALENFLGNGLFINLILVRHGPNR